MDDVPQHPNSHEPAEDRRSWLGSDPPAIPAIAYDATRTLTEGEVLNLAGTAEPGVTVELLYWGSVAAQTVADERGTWSVNLRSIEWGSHIYTARAVRGDGRVSESSAPLTVVVAPPGAALTGEEERRRAGSVLSALRRFRRVEHPSESSDESTIDEEWSRLAETESVPASPVSPIPGPPLQGTAVSGWRGRAEHAAESSARAAVGDVLPAEAPALTLLETSKPKIPFCVAQSVRAARVPTVVWGLERSAAQPPSQITTEPSTAFGIPPSMVGVEDTTACSEQVAPEEVSVVESERPPLEVAVEARRRFHTVSPIRAFGVTRSPEVTLIEAVSVLDGREEPTSLSAGTEFGIAEAGAPQQDDGAAAPIPRDETGTSGISDDSDARPLQHDQGTPRSGLQNIFREGAQAWLKYRKRRTS